MNSGFFERYHAEAGDVLNAILTHSRDCIKLLSLDGRIEYASSSAAGALGLSCGQDAEGSDWLSFWPESERLALRAAIDAAARGASTRFDGRTHDSAGRTQHWDVTISPVRGSDGATRHLLAVSTDVTAQIEAAEQGRLRWERAEHQVSRADTITRELRHRLKNQLAVVGAVAKLLARHTDDAKELARKLEDKLIALAQAQDLLTMLHDEPLAARDAVRQVLSASGAGERVEIEAMPDAALPDESVQQLALILGELQTNALKHGALCDEGGRVFLSGADSAGVLSLCWREQCVAPVTPVENGGGGFQLIQRLGSAGGKQSVIAWEPAGIVVNFHVRTTEWVSSRAAAPG